MAASEAGALPPTSTVLRRGTHRLIQSRHHPGESVLTALADNDEDLAALFDLDHASNDRLLAEHDLLPGIGVRELVFGIPHYRVINAAFCHAHPMGSRFNGPDRGAWYASFALRTAQREVAFHHAVALSEINRFEDSVTWDDYQADVAAELHDLRGAARFVKCLSPDSYVESQNLAAILLESGSQGVIYPSVRDNGGTCVALFRPALVNHLRRGRTWRFTWRGTPEPVIRREYP